HQLAVPQKMVRTILHCYHDSKIAVHRGTKAMFGRIRPMYFWFGMMADIRHYCNSCVVCAKFKSSNSTPRAPMKSIPVNKPFERVGIDLITAKPLRTAGNTCILVCVDQFTKFVELKAIPNKSTIVVATAF